MEFIIYGKPQGKQRAKVCIRGGYARAYTPAETESYENLVKMSYRKVQGETMSKLWDKPVKATIKAYWGIPKSFSRKRTKEAVEGKLRPRTKPDIDNVCKAVCDALNGIAYRDDNQIVLLIAEKFYSQEPKVKVKLEEMIYG